MHFETKFSMRDKVVIDGGGIVGWVTGIFFRESLIEYEVSYVHNGTSVSPSIEEFRLKKA